ncbi:MAG: CdaR family protein [Defluviitaleaceae bacterium]|nr:CdaR family protein [Defluviitaleaceae bacterium]
MEKIIDFLTNLLLAIVYPNRLLKLFRVKNLDQNSNKILGNDKVLKVLALALALIFVVNSRYTRGTPNEATRTVEGIPLTTLLNENYTHFGSPIPTQITVVLSGDQTQLDLLSVNDVRAYLDLDRLERGIEHRNIPIRIEGVSDQINATSTPSVVSGIYIAEVEERLFRVALAINNRETLDELDSRYGYRTFLDPAYEYVIAKGPQVLLDDVVEVRAMFNASQVRTEPGNHTYDAVLVANNISGHPIGAVELTPASVAVIVEIYEDVRTIYIEFDENISGVPRNQYDIISVTADIAEIQVWGDFDEMEDVIQLGRIRFADLDALGQLNELIELPPGVYTEVDGEIVTHIEIVITVEFETRSAS